MTWIVTEQTLSRLHILVTLLNDKIRLTTELQESAFLSENFTAVAFLSPSIFGEATSQTITEILDRKESGALTYKDRVDEYKRVASSFNVNLAVSFLIYILNTVIHKQNSNLFPGCLLSVDFTLFWPRRLVEACPIGDFSRNRIVQVDQC